MRWNLKAFDYFSYLFRASKKATENYGGHFWQCVDVCERNIGIQEVNSIIFWLTSIVCKRLVFDHPAVSFHQREFKLSTKTVFLMIHYYTNQNNVFFADC